jgi:hypothetical protein
MTEAKTLRRRRRTEGANDAPPADLRSWFEAGACWTAAPWSALLQPDHEMLPARWQAWKAENPGAHADAVSLRFLEPTQ